MAASLREAYSEDELYILVAESNSGYFTYDGIETGGERVCVEVEETLANCANITKLSVIGYSLGGLVARYAVGLLQAKGVLDRLECKNFIAFASPFLGVRSPTRGTFSTIFNALGARTLSMSGRQLFGIDSFRDTGRPLLAVMTDMESIFMAGLRQFKRRALYANIVNDRSANYYTTSISKTDPYAAIANEGGEVEDLPVNFVPGYGDVILDPEQPIDLSKLPEAYKNVKHRVANGLNGSQSKTSTRRALRKFLANPRSREARMGLLESAPMFAFALLLPLAASLFLISSVYQGFMSSRRRQLHEGGMAGIDIKSYRVPLWIRSLQHTVEDAYEDIDTAQEPGFVTPVGSSLDASSAQAPDESSKGQHRRGFSQSSLSLSQQQLAHESREVRHSKDDHQPVLALSPEQFTMIANLDTLDWHKYRVWIHNVRHSHAAIIVRHDSTRFDEGKTVLRHFVNEEFLV